MPNMGNLIGNLITKAMIENEKRNLRSNSTETFLLGPGGREVYLPSKCEPPLRTNTDLSFEFMLASVIQNLNHKIYIKMVSGC